MVLPEDIKDREHEKFALDGSGNAAVRVITSGSITDIDLINNPATTWTITREDGQPDSETITLANGDIYTRTFTYTGQMLTARSAWVKS